MLLITPNTPYGITLNLGEGIPQPFMWGFLMGLKQRVVELTLRGLMNHTLLLLMHEMDESLSAHHPVS